MIRLSRYERAAARLLRPSMQQEMEEEIAVEPDRHPVMPGTGGFAKHDGADQGAGSAEACE
jgi:hypothetical protein